MKFLSQFERQDGVVVLNNLSTIFEENYIKVREKEGRVLTDEMVLGLPQTPSNYQHYREWKLREATANRALKYFQQRQFKTVLDLGCGNGWFTNAMASKSNMVVGIDMNMHELRQANRVFGKSGLNFCYADVFTSELPKEEFNLITINAAVQYFPDLETLINRLLDLLAPEGEIHILDSPFYQPQELVSAQKRTDEYFSEMGYPEMAESYFHHGFSALQCFNFKVIFNPKTLKNKVTRKLGFATSPFPWIIIKK